MKKQMRMFLIIMLCISLGAGNTSVVMGAAVSEPATDTSGEDESTMTDEQETKEVEEEVKEEVKEGNDETQGTDETQEIETGETQEEMPEADETQEGTIEDEEPSTEVTQPTETQDTDEAIESENEVNEGDEEVTPDTEIAAEEEKEVEVTPELLGKKVMEDGLDSLKATISQIAVMDSSGKVLKTFELSKSAIDKGLQEALDYVRDNAGDKILTVSIPSGTYTSQETIKVYSNTILDLSAGNVVIKRAGSGTLIRFGRPTDGDARGYNAYENITIKGSSNSYATLDGGGIATSILRFAHAQNITLQYLTFTNVKDAHHAEFAGSDNVLVEHCNFKGFTLTNSSSVTNYEALQLDILQESHFGNYGAYDGTINKNITITNNTFDGVNRGVGTHSGIVGEYFNNVTITNNLFSNVTGYAIVTTNYLNSTISNNNIKNCGAGIYFRHISQNYINYYQGNTATSTPNVNSIISDNSISIKSTSYNSARYGIRVYGENLTSAKSKTYTDEDTNKKVTVKIPKGDYRVKNLNISGNSITASTLCNGVWLEGVYESNVNSNVITYSTSSSVSSNAKDENKSCDGIKLEKSVNNRISGNTISDTSGKKAFVRNGIYVKDGSSNNTLDKNNITKTQENGIHVSKSKSCILENNQIFDASKHGIYMNDASATSISFNKIAKKSNSTSSVRGVCVDGSSASVDVIASNEISNCKEHGIMINHSAVAKKITGNTIKTVKKNGIYSNLGAKVTTISANNITSAKNIGIAIYSNKKKVTISKNTISKSSVYGIDICIGTKASVSGNTVSKSGKGAVRVQQADYRRFNLGNTKINKISASKGKLTLTWKKAKDATQYVVYRSESKNGKYKKVSTVKATTYADKVKKGTTYYYKVVPVGVYSKVTITGLDSKIKSAKASK